MNRTSATALQKSPGNESWSQREATREHGPKNGMVESNLKRGEPKLPQFTVLLPTNQEVYQEHELVTGRTDKICRGWEVILQAIRPIKLPLTALNKQEIC